MEPNSHPISLAADLLEHARQHYIYLHEHPELSFEEDLTTAYIREVLQQLQISYTEIGRTGLIGLLTGKDANRHVALWADIDALPIQENKSHPCVSGIPGKMHACGHDLHTAILLGAAEYLVQQTLPFNLMLIFQPGEEVLPGGAQAVLQQAFFQTHQPEWIIALHAEPELPVGQLGLCPGQYMASGDEIYITLRGPGGHAALPDQSVDLIVIASHIIIALQQVTSRKASPFTPTVLTFGNIRCNSVMNVIPREICLEGTFRTFNESWRSKAKKQIRQIAIAMAESMGAHPEINIVEGYPCLYNNPEKVQETLHILRQEFGEEAIIRLGQRMTTEDFARYSQIIPATFLRLGVKDHSQSIGKLHTPDFFPHPEALAIGIRTFCSLILNHEPSCQNS